jgi:uncharacterized protein
MPVTPTYPGIYIQEAPSSSHTVIASPTNIAVFIGYTHPLKTDSSLWGQAVQIFGWPDYVRQFGGYVRSAAFANQAFNIANPAMNVGDMALAVSQFFLNGGTTAYIVALDAKPTSPPGGLTPPPPQNIGGINFSQLEITDEYYALQVQILPVGATGSPPSSATADIIITYGPVTQPPLASTAAPSAPVQFGSGMQVETYRQLVLNDAKSPNFIATRINGVSALVTVDATTLPGNFTAITAAFPTLLDASAPFFQADDFTAVLQPDTSLDKVPTLNLMVIPGVTDSLVTSTAISFCERRMVFMIVDPSITDSADGSKPALPGLVSNPLIQDTVATQVRSKNAALYFPYLQSSDPFTGAATNLVTGQPFEIPPAPTVAGIFAATDVARGVWKAPAGFQAVTNNTTGVTVRGRMTDPRQGTLNPISVNCLRDFPNVGTIVFGSRTLASTYDQQWTYVPVRRMALFLEQTFLANLKWVIFEPNAEPLWTAITMSLNAFMLGLFKQGAFQGTTPSDAFRVQCDSQTTTQTDIDSGVVNIIVSFAPLKPAEFVVITIAQLAGQTQTS